MPIKLDQLKLREVLLEAPVYGSEGESCFAGTLVVGTRIATTLGNGKGKGNEGGRLKDKDTGFTCHRHCVYADEDQAGRRLLCKNCVRQSSSQDVQEHVKTLVSDRCWKQERS